jgi:hypothetical protein
MSSEHILAQSPSSFGISSYAQELMCFVGQQMVFSDAEQMLHTLKGVNINAKQIERVCHYYGSLIEEEDAEMTKNQVCHSYSPGQRNQLHYAMLDGAMYLTREQKWKEAKIGRIFKANDMVELSDKRNTITNSMYVAHLGSQKEFFPKFEYYLDELKSLVIIADGATWIWKWADDLYPHATQILDFYHAKEHLCQFAINYFKDTQVRHQWIEEQCQTMLENDVGKVIEAIEQLPASTTKATEDQKQNLIGYYRKNRKRMRYSVFLKSGLLIGSGAIESAHRNVLQQRMKLSGQRWTMAGFQQMANLRVVYKSNKWSRVTALTKMAA